jgi:hypothetical protein
MIIFILANGGSCLETDGCIDEHAICVEVPPSNESRSGHDTLRYETDNLARDPHHTLRQQDHKTRASSGNYICVCDDGYEPVSMRCKLSGKSSCKHAIIQGFSTGVPRHTGVPRDEFRCAADRPAKVT